MLGENWRNHRHKYISRFREPDSRLSVRILDKKWLTVRLNDRSLKQFSLEITTATINTHSKEKTLLWWPRRQESPEQARRGHDSDHACCWGWKDDSGMWNHCYICQTSTPSLKSYSFWRTRNEQLTAYYFEDFFSKAGNVKQTIHFSFIIFSFLFICTLREPSSNLFTTEICRVCS